MTDAKRPTEQSEEKKLALESAPQAASYLDAEKSSPARSSSKSGPILGTLSIAMVLALGAGIYYHSHQQEQRQLGSSQMLQQQLKVLHDEQAQEKVRVDALLNQQNKALTVAEQLQAAQTQQIKALEEKVSALSGNDGRTWLIAEADFLVKLAGRKLWSDQDATTATALLKSADNSLAQMNDPSLIALRRALTEDMASLSGIRQIDFDGTILKLNQLSNQVDELHLTNSEKTQQTENDVSEQIGSSINNWRHNLTVSWHNFIAEFITIRRRDDSAVPLLAPNQNIYLRENIRAQLLIAAQAVPRHQNEVYQKALENVSAWVHSYFDANNAMTKTFLTDINALQQQSISMDLPAELKSQPILDKLMQTKVRNLIAGASDSVPRATTPVAQGE